MLIRIQIILLLFGVQLYSTHIIKVKDDYKTEIRPEKYDKNTEDISVRNPKDNFVIGDQINENADIKDIDVTRTKRFVVRQSRPRYQPSYNSVYYQQPTKQLNTNKQQTTKQRRREINNARFFHNSIRRIRLKIRKLVKNIFDLLTGFKKKPPTTTTSLPTTPTTTDLPTTTPAPTTTKSPTTTAIPTTTDSPTTISISTTTDAPTTTSIPTTTDLTQTTVVPTTTDINITPTILTTTTEKEDVMTIEPATSDISVATEPLSEEATTEMNDYDKEGNLRETLAEVSKKDDLQNRLSIWTISYKKVLNEHIENIVEDKLNKALEDKDIKTNDKHQMNNGDPLGDNELKENDNKNLDKRDTVTNLNIPNSDVLKQTDKSYVNVKANTIYENHVGKGHVTNIFVIYPNVDKKRFEALNNINSTNANSISSSTTKPLTITQFDEAVSAGTDKVTDIITTTDEDNRSSVTTESNYAKSTTKSEVTTESNTIKDSSTIETTKHPDIGLDSRNTSEEETSTNAEISTNHSTKIYDMDETTVMASGETNIFEDLITESSTEKDSNEDDTKSEAFNATKESESSTTDSSKETASGTESNDADSIIMNLTEEEDDSAMDSKEERAKIDLRVPKVYR